MKIDIIKKSFLLFLFTIFSFVSSKCFANNLKIENFNVVNINESNNTITYSCDVSWDNSWKNTTNNDSIWIFLKYTTDAGLNWHHASMWNHGINPAGFSVPANFEIIVPNDEKGFFLQRKDYGNGTASAENIQFVWDYGQDGLSDSLAKASSTINKIFGIEMVYIPAGSFYAGDGDSASDYRFKQGISDYDPWYITSEEAITTTNSESDGYYYVSSGAAGENLNGDIFIVPTSFPKGYKAFYLMKYELTEGQWVAFFNTLSTNAKINRDITGSSNGGKNSDGIINRNTISWDSSNPVSPASTLRSDRPVSYISWPDLLAYADWAALRPITELEFEKSARGSDISSLADEYAWGKTNYNIAEAHEIYPDTDEDGSEQIFDGSANINRNSLGWTSGDGRAGGIAQAQKGPLRSGIFAESSTNRTTSGAGYYGSMELSGNLNEMVVSLGKNQGRQFLGTNGDGELSTISGYEGNATNNDWPGINLLDSARGVTSTAGSGYRGGDFQSPDLRHYQISNRTNASKDPDSLGYSQRYDAAFGIFQGGRLGRTAQ